MRPIAAYGLSFYDLPFILVFCLSAILISYLVDFRRRAEENLRQRNDELEARVAERTRELVEANKLKDEIMASVSHDLRAPLTSILGWIEIVETNGNDRKAISKALSVIKRNAERQSQMVRDLADTTGIQTNGVRLRMQPVDLVKLLEETEEQILPIAVEKEITIDFSFDQPSVLLHGDPDRLAQVIDNLLVNAIKYTPKGGLVSVRLETTDAVARIIVSDSGKGIDAQLLPHVFDRFRQGENDEPGGLGLGLAIVKQIVKAHGGTVSAASLGEGNGSTFVVTLDPERTVCSQRAVTPMGRSIQESVRIEPKIKPAPKMTAK
jgi:signal transduction histidine kinase